MEEMVLGAVIMFVGIITGFKLGLKSGKQGERGPQGPPGPMGAKGDRGKDAV